MSDAARPLPPAIQQYLDAQSHRAEQGPVEVERLLAVAEHTARAALGDDARPDAPAVTPFRLREFAAATGNCEVATRAQVDEVELELNIELGRAHMYQDDARALRGGSVVPLNRRAGDPVDIRAGGRLVARGEIFVLNDNFCVRVTERVRGHAGS